MGKYNRAYVGKTFNDGNLVVVDGGDKKGYVQVKCNLCEEDPELFGNATFETQYSALIKGGLPCGCSANVHWTLSQHEVRIKRKIADEKLPIKFVSFGNIETPLHNTRVNLFCLDRNEHYSIKTINSFFTHSVGNNGAKRFIDGKDNQYCRHAIGKQFNNGKLVIINGGNKRGSVVVKCSECANDTELFADGVFEAKLGELTAGGLPCGCSAKVNWTLDQHKIRINRKILEEKLPIEFVGFGKKVKPLGHTSLILYCKENKSEYEIGRISHFYQGIGTQGKVYTTKERLEEYSKLNPKYTVWETGAKTKQGDAVLGFHCSLCESNGYESLFTISAANTLKGQLPCYCSPKISRMSGDHIIEVSKRKLEEQGIEGVSVFGAVQKARAWCTVFMCQTHGIYSRTYLNIENIGCHCTKCTPPKTGYDKTKKGYIYLLNIQTPTEVILGYGITNKLNNRLTTHKRNLKSIGATITNIQVFEGSGSAVLAVENAIKALHPTGLIGCEGFRRESISIDMKDKVLEKCSKLKELDNTDKLL